LSIKGATNEALELILSFVRGERPWTALEKAGVHIETKDDGYEIDNPWHLAAKAHPRDVAQGLLFYRRTPDQLQRWARIILAGSSFLDFRNDFETTTEGDVLLNALWDSGFGDGISQEAIAVAESLVNQR
jgi:hypothetical protein